MWLKPALVKGLRPAIKNVLLYICKTKNCFYICAPLAKQITFFVAAKGEI